MKYSTLAMLNLAPADEQSLQHFMARALLPVRKYPSLNKQAPVRVLLPHTFGWKTILDVETRYAATTILLIQIGGEAAHKLEPG